MKLKMKVQSYEISINKFLTNYLGVQLDYSRKKWTHVKLIEILNSYHLESCILKDQQVDKVDLYRGDILSVVDQYGKRKYYRNPRLFALSYKVDSIFLNKQVKDKEQTLCGLYKKIDFSGNLAYIHEIYMLNKEIQEMIQYIDILEQNEYEQQQERVRYMNTMKEKEDKTYDKHKRKRKVKYYKS